MEILLSSVLSYLISLAVNERSASIHKKREATLQKLLSDNEKVTKALQSKRTLREEVTVACTRLAQAYDTLSSTSSEKPAWKLLANTDFQDELYRWLTTGGIVEGDPIKEKIFNRIQRALPHKNTLQTCNVFFEQLERELFSNEILSRWRHQQSLSYLRAEVSVLKAKAEEAAGIYSEEKQQVALENYCDQAFKSWDIIDLTNLPEGDVDIATQNLLVRQLYMPLRIDIDHEQTSDDSLKLIERERSLRRSREAGRITTEGERQKPRNAGIGELLKTNQRLVILGDPGGGKTTMLRWLATAMLLRHKNDAALVQLPDVHTLPDESWIPVLIRCRDLGEADLCRSFSEFLKQHLLKSALRPEQATVMHALLLEKIARNEILLLIDGLDEITNTQVRVRFCQELERTVARYPDVRIIVTSRIVGYRDMPYRMGEQFQHGVIAELRQEHKDLFAKRWIEVTEQRQSPEERKRREAELVRALHASDRIERLTGNPMLLTTLALVKRKVGKLPNRRNKLYAEAVGVLLNWNPGFYAPIDDAEAIPQLEYLAYEMCKRGVQRITNDEIMDLLEQFRRDYPAVRPVRNHSEAEFLELLEARSSILIKAGNIWRKGQRHEEAAWEFRHLTFQEYLAARALIDGKYPNREKSQSLASQVAPLAGIIHDPTAKSEIDAGEHAASPDESKISDPWTETLRLLVIDCKDDDVDDVLQAILKPMENERAEETQMVRTVLAGLCLADEPNVSEEAASAILTSLADQVRNDRDSRTDVAGVELCRGQWRDLFRDIVIQRYLNDPFNEANYLSFWASVSSDELDPEKITQNFFEITRDSILNDNDIEAITAAVTVLNNAFYGRFIPVDGISEALVNMLTNGLSGNGGTCFAAAWALGWLSSGPAENDENDAKSYWKPTSTEIDAIGDALVKAPKHWERIHFWLMNILANTAEKSAAKYVSPFLTLEHDSNLRNAAVSAIAKVGNASHIPILKQLLAEKDDSFFAIRVASSLAALGDHHGIEKLINIWKNSDELAENAGDELLNYEADATSRKLLSVDMDGRSPMIPWTEVINDARVLACATKLSLEEGVVRKRYSSLQEKYDLKIAFT